MSGIKIDQALIGSCSNGRFEDIEIAARMLKGRKVAKGVRFVISPASQQVYLECMKAGLIQQLDRVGRAGGDARVAASASPRSGYVSAGEVCITATTRNFKGRKGSLDARALSRRAADRHRGRGRRQDRRIRKRCSMKFDLNRVLRGRVWKFGDSIDTDSINRTTSTRRWKS